MPLTIEQKLIDDVAVLQIAGWITLGRDCQQLEWKVKDLIQKKQARIVLDLSGVDHIDSAGIGLIVMCHGKAREAGGDVRLAGVKGGVEKLLRMVNLDRVVEFYPTADAAARSFGSPISESGARR